MSSPVISCVAFSAGRHERRLSGREPRLGSDVALKVLAPELATDDAFRARFIYDTGSSDGLLYIAMRFVAGTDMRQMVKKRGTLLPETAVFLLGQAARALDAAHRKGLVHRDVKPGNLLIERGSDDEDPDHVYLTDFGIALGLVFLTAALICQFTAVTNTHIGR